jgi:hypothetical protein
MVSIDIDTSGLSKEEILEILEDYQPEYRKSLKPSNDSFEQTLYISLGIVFIILIIVDILK